MLLGGAGEELPAVLGLGAIADVERRFKGRGVVKFEVDRDADDGPETGGDRGLSDFAVLLPLLCDDKGGLGVFEEEDAEDSF